MHDFTLLKPISKIVDILGKVVVSLAAIVGVILITAGDFNIIVGISLIFGGGIIGLLLILLSQLVNLFLQIEENTRKHS